MTGTRAVEEVNERRLSLRHSETGQTFNRQIDELIAQSVRVGACVNAARADGAEDELRSRGIDLQVARDNFLRWTLERATVITF
ncbi:hypothetical protein [Nocardia sp. R6R-6]|uniref:hypothetical protein n=1 Tax=Nocardia sp. R6R-6 TaxID=3459303 RepID=UPI00403D8D31